MRRALRILPPRVEPLFEIDIKRGEQDMSWQRGLPALVWESVGRLFAAAGFACRRIPLTYNSSRRANFSWPFPVPEHWTVSTANMFGCIREISP